MNDDYETGVDVLGAEEVVGFLPLIMAGISAAASLVGPIKSLFDHSAQDAQNKANAAATAQELAARSSQQITQQQSDQMQMVAKAQQWTAAQNAKLGVKTPGTPAPAAQPGTPAAQQAAAAQQQAQMQMMQAPGGKEKGSSKLVYAGVAVVGIGAWLLFRKKADTKGGK